MLSGILFFYLALFIQVNPTEIADLIFKGFRGCHQIETRKEEQCFDTLQLNVRVIILDQLEDVETNDKDSASNKESNHN